jgi:type I restriction enzyme S subunit
MLPELLKLIFNESDIVKDQFTIMSNATTIEVIYSYSLKDIVLPIIPMSEQKIIFSFLHSQCSKLDSIIADLEKQIDTLQKYKKSLITETVTKGLDKSVPMKNSGIEWIGQIPEHWSVKRLKYVMNNFDSQRKPIEAQNRSQEGDVLYDYYGASGVIDKIDEYIFDKTALLIGEDGANLVLRNLPLIYIAHGKYWVNNHAHILRPKKDSDLYYMAHQMEIIDYSLFITGSAQPKLSQENLNNVILVVPPLSEQKTMAEYLNEKVSNIDSIIQDKKKQLTIVQGHKKSLIYEYVTGKKRVTEVK